MPRKPGAKALIAYEGRFVFVLRDNIASIPYPNTWNLPGGGLEHKENPEQALRRELLEEVNLIPAVVHPFGTSTYTDDMSIVHRFFVSISEKERATVRLVNEGQRLEWMSLSEALQRNLSPHLRAYLTDNREAIELALQGEIQAKDWECAIRFDD